MELRTKFTKGQETCESLQSAGFLASPQLTGKGLPLKKAAAHADKREVECPQQLSQWAEGRDLEPNPGPE